MIVVRAFAALNPLPGFEAVAHCYEQRGTKFVMLPATAHGPDPQTAEARLRGFLDDEIEREKARIEQGRRLGLANRKGTTT